MRAKKAVGRTASAMKYDILSALGVMALAGDKHRQRLVLRLMVLITTRYNWQSNELSIGRMEIARLWSVDERTVKRGMAKLRSLGWLEVKRAGVKGRVTVYALDFGALLRETRPVWGEIGSDFEDRMVASHEGPATDGPVSDPKVIPFQPRSDSTPSVDGAGGLWPQMLDDLGRRDPALAVAWFGDLTEAERKGDTLVLIAPTRFKADYLATHFAARLLEAARRVDKSIRRVEVIPAE